MSKDHETVARGALAAQARALRDDKRRELLGVAAVIYGHIVSSPNSVGGLYASTAPTAVNAAKALIAAVDKEFEASE